MYIENVIFPCISWDRPLLRREKLSCFWKKIPSFQLIQERSYASALPFGKKIFSEILKKVSYFSVTFFEKDHVSFSAEVVRSYFREKEISSFPIIQERSYSSAVLFGKNIFSGRLEKGNVVFRAVLFSCSTSIVVSFFSRAYWLLDSLFCTAIHYE